MESKHKPFSVMPSMSAWLEGDTLPEHGQTEWILRKISILETALTVLTTRVKAKFPKVDVTMLMNLAAKYYSLPGSQIIKRLRIIEIRCALLESILYHTH